MSRHAKSRSGCRLCKIKRMKCDETVPSCQNCLKRGLTCPGYRQTLKWSTKYEADFRKESDAASIPQFSQLVSEASRSVQIKQTEQTQQTQQTQQIQQARPPRRKVIKKESSPSALALEVPTPSSQGRASSIGASSSSSSETSPQSESQDLVWQDVGSALSAGSSSSSPLLYQDQKPQEHVAAPGTEAFALELWQPWHLMSPGRQLSNPSSSLVELWFRSVCGSWAAFDSPSNPFRQLCSSLWSSHEPLFFSLQTMAAAYLPKRSPNISEIVHLAPQLSNQALIRELKDLFEAPNLDKGLPAGLLTSLFCMSSCLNWIDTRQLGVQYLRNARSVIELMDSQKDLLSRSDQDLLEFFRGCLIYEEMLRSIVTDDEEDIRALLSWNPSPSDAIESLRLHPWAGVPVNFIGLFGKVMVLCRRSRKLWSKTSQPTYHVIYQSMKDIEEGKELETALLSLEIPLASEIVHAGQTDDVNVESHLYTAAEAFRLSSLLQLYQTFPDLLLSYSQKQTGGETETGAPDQWIRSISLRIVDLIESIPPNSPMRCLQPLLCLCAGSALRGSPTAGTSTQGALQHNGMLLLDNPLEVNLGDITPATSVALTIPGCADQPSPIRLARRKVRDRLTALEQFLPPQPVQVIRELLDTVWSRYDHRGPESRIHWLDIMAESSLVTVFG